MQHLCYLSGERFNEGEAFSVTKQGNKTIYIRGTTEQKSKTEGNRETKAVLGNREHRKSRF